jgi:phosphate/sulfate permease
MNARRAELMVAVSMALGVLFGSKLSFTIGTAVLEEPVIDLLALISAAVILLSLLTRAMPVSVSQIVLSSGIGFAIVSGSLSDYVSSQALFWVVSPLMVFLITPFAYKLLKGVVRRATSVKALDSTLKTSINLSLILLAFWRGANLGGVLMGTVATEPSYSELAALTAALVLVSCLFAPGPSVFKGDMTYYPDPAAFTSRALSSLIGVWTGLLFGVTASFTQLFYASDLYFRSKMLVSKGYIARKLLISWVPAISSGLLAVLLFLLRS